MSMINAVPYVKASVYRSVCLTFMTLQCSDGGVRLLLQLQQRDLS